MPIVNRIAEFHEEMTAWRRHLHAHPETAYQEHETAAFVADKLAAFGIAVARGIGRTGVVGTLDGARGAGPAIALRADMDALFIAEKNDLPWRSLNDGRMHACGHDGHTTMLLGAARYLAETRNFAGRVHFVFQPAEEVEGGARAMIDDGLFERFPVESVYGLHNMPDVAVGRMAVRGGPVMAACDNFELRLVGTGAHAAMPHQGADAILAAAQLVTALQAIASRETDPLDSVVVTVTQIHAGDAWNVIPEDVVLRGTVRSLRPGVQDRAEAALRRIVAGIAAAFGVAADIRYERGYPPTINDEDEAAFAARVAAAVVGAERVARDMDPKMGAEDFAFMLRETPGAYAWLGGGRGGADAGLHNPYYDFNDEALPVGASYWARLVETRLAPDASRKRGRGRTEPA